MDNRKDGKWDLDAYLERIHMERPEKADRAYLDRLVTQHLIHVPFEALDLYTGKAPISQELDELYEKVVQNRRGGYCFELNKLFQFLLKDLGYDTYPCFCRVQGDKAESGHIMHRGNIVRLDGAKLFCDVGFGGAMCRGAVELTPGLRQTKGTDLCWFEPYNEYWFDLFRQQQDLFNEDGSVTKGVPRRELRVCIAEAEEQDFLPLNQITSGPDSVFGKVLMVGRLTEDGALSISPDNVFSKTTGNRREHRTLEDRVELWKILREEFGLVVGL